MDYANEIIPAANALIDVLARMKPISYACDQDDAKEVETEIASLCKLFANLIDAKLDNLKDKLSPYFDMKRECDTAARMFANFNDAVCFGVEHSSYSEREARDCDALHERFDREVE